MTTSTSSRRRTDRTDRRAAVGLAAGLAVFVLSLAVDLPGLEEPGERMLAIFLLAIVFWVTEAIPLFATAALVIFLEILAVSDQALVSLPESFMPPGYAGFFAALANPVLMLFLGGFFLARGASKFKLDRALAGVLLRPFGTEPGKILLGLMLVTAGFSMFMSNTATTATMLAVVLPVIGGLDPGDRLRPALALSIPLAANVGGIGTPVGTPPNAIAVGQLAATGVSISFAKWMLLAVPGMVVVLIVAWAILRKLFPASSASVSIDVAGEFDTSRPAVVFYAVFAATVLLWLTESLHGLASGVVGFLPVVVLLGTRIFDADDLRGVQWDVLWLVAGGIALGNGVAATGLDQWLVDRVDWSSVPPTLLVLMLAAVALLLSTVISNSAAANLLIPLGLSLALSPAVAVDPLLAGFFIAIGSSLAMALPISTPPNAIAYSTGAVTTRDMVVVGALVGIAGLAVFLVSQLLWSPLGLS